MNKQLRLTYTLVAEGYTEYAFIPLYLNYVASKQGIQLVRSRLGFKGGSAGKERVLKEVESIFTAALGEGHQLLIAGVDLDAPDYEKEQPEHKRQCQELTKAFGDTNQQRNRIVHYVPIQAIEQWLAYQAYKVKIAEEYSPNSLKSKGQSELKKMLYKDRKDGAAMEQIAEKIALAADFDELAKQSRSFRHFHNQVTSFLEAFAASDQ